MSPHLIDRLIENLPAFALIGTLIVASSMASASETALFALTRKQLSDLAALNTVSARKVAQLRANPRGLLSTLLLTNTAINMLLYSVLGVTTVRVSGGSTAVATAIGIGGFVVTVFGAEILPKQIALTLSVKLSLMIAPVIRGLVIATSPLRWLLENVFVEPLVRLVGGTTQSGSSLAAEELQELVSICEDGGLIDDRENRIIHHVVELSETRVSALMVPRVDFSAFNVAHDRRDLDKLFKTARLLRMPVYEGTIDNIIGTVAARDTFLNPDKPIRELLKPVQFVPEQAGAESVLQHFRRTGTQMAIVVDEYGGLAGVIAMEDIVEAIVGNLSAPDETGDEPRLVRLGPDTFTVDAAMDIDDFRRAFELPIEDTRFDTVGGLIVESFGRLPEPGDEVTIGHVVLRVMVMRKRRVFRAMVTLLKPTQENADLSLLLAAADDAQSTADRREGGAA